MLGFRSWPGMCCISPTISPGAGTEGSAIWRPITACERRRPAVGECRLREEGLCEVAEMTSAMQFENNN